MPYQHDPVPPEALRWRCDLDDLEFETTLDFKPIEGVVGQESAVDALRFGLEVDAPGQNIYVRGLTGTGRSTLIRRLLEEIAPGCALAPDHCYVHNFSKPDRPALLTLPRGTGREFCDVMDDFIEFVREDLAKVLSGDVLKSRAKSLERNTATRIEAITQPFEAELASAGLTLVLAQVGTVSRQLILPLIDGEPAPPERLETLVGEGRMTADELETLKTKAADFGERLEDVGEQVQTIQIDSHEQMKRLVEDEARALLRKWFSRLEGRWPGEAVSAFLATVIDDVVVRGLPALGESDVFVERYRVNLISAHDTDEGCPIVEELTPSVQTLLGTIDRSVTEEQAAFAPHMLIYGGSVLRADGGFLILDARDVLTEPGAWRALVRTLRSGHIEMVAPDGPVTWRVPPIKPEPIPVSVKVILLGSGGLYYSLDAMDADFPQLFKVLADFDDVIDRDPQGIEWYARVIARFARDEGLTPIDRSGVAALCEHGARIAAQAGKLTTRFGRLADIAREAGFLASKAGAERTSSEHVSETVARTKRRANLPSRRFQDAVTRGVIRIQTDGAAIGQVNGLAVIQAGPLTYGFPSRITASIGPGTEGTVNIEGEAQMSGRIHTKGFHILLGLLRNLLRPPHPLAFDASIAFEQSYGGIDGDSASGAEFCCLLSALADVPLRQDLAMTGAIDQHGNIEPIGAANEKIEGFFDVCRSAGFTGTQGVLIPHSNAGDLMLRPDVVEACVAGRFAIYAVERIEQALGILTGLEPGESTADGFAPDTLLGRATARATAFWSVVDPRP